MTENTSILDSYKNSFKSSLGTYTYLLLNQKIPEIFAISTNTDNESPVYKELTEILENSQSLDEIIKKVEKISEIDFSKVVHEENKVDKETVLKTIRNIKYSNIDWSSNDSWESIKALVEYNKYSKYLNSENINDLKNKMNEFVENFNLESLSVNPNYNPREFIKNLTDGIKTMCDSLNISHSQVGLGVLSLNYQTEEGDFTGYMSNQKNDEVLSKMVIKKSNVFAHEWLHFIDSALGTKGHPLTSLMEIFGESFKFYNPDLESLGNFTTKINEKIKDKNSVDFTKSILSLSHFLEKYALNSKDFKNDIENICINFEKEINKKENKNSADLIVEFKRDIELLLNDNYPTRYFSFIEAQCNIMIERNNKFEINQLIDFSNKADLILDQNNYTSSNVEIFARTFESFLYDKLKKENKTAKVLADSYESDMYQQGDLGKNINELWGNMWSGIKTTLDKIYTNKDILNVETIGVKTNIEAMRNKYIKKSTSTLKLD